MDEEIGSVMMDVEEELVMPEIPIRPNNSIPTAIGIMLIIGSLLAGFLALGSGGVYLLDDQTLNDAGLTDEEIRTFDMLKETCLLYTSPSPRDLSTSRMPSSA